MNDRSRNFPNWETKTELKHYGVLGMKWGVRRSQATLDRAAGRTPKTSLKTRMKSGLKNASAKLDNWAKAQPDFLKSSN